MVTDAELVPEVAAEPDGTLATSAALDPAQLPAGGPELRRARSPPSTAARRAATPPTATRRWR